MNSRRAALPRSSQAHGSGRRAVAPDREVDQPGDDGVVLEAQHAAEVARGHAGARRAPRTAAAGARRRAPAPSWSAAPRIVWRSPIGLQRVQPEQVGRPTGSRRSARRRGPPVLDAGREHVDRRLDRQLPDRHGRHRRARELAHRRVERRAAAGHARADLGVGDDRRSPPSAQRRPAAPRRRPRRAGRPRRESASSGSQNAAGRMIAETGVVPTSCRPWTVWPARVRRLRIVCAT